MFDTYKNPNSSVPFQVAPKINNYYSNVSKCNNYTESICFLSGCTESSQCSYQDNKGICDTTNQICVGKLPCLMHENNINKNYPLIFQWLLSGCTEDSQCTYQYNKGICDTTNQICIGKLQITSYKNNIIEG